MAASVAADKMHEHGHSRKSRRIRCVMVGEFGMFWLSEFWLLDEQPRLIGD